MNYGNSLEGGSRWPGQVVFTNLSCNNVDIHLIQLCCTWCTHVFSAAGFIKLKYSIVVYIEAA